MSEASPTCIFHLLCRRLYTGRFSRATTGHGGRRRDGGNRGDHTWSPNLSHRGYSRALCTLKFAFRRPPKILKSVPTNMSKICDVYRCRYCGFKTSSGGGLSSHVSQSPPCLGKLVAANKPTSHPHKRPRSESPTPGSHALGDQPDETPLYSSLLGDHPSQKRARVDDEDDPVGIKMDVVFEEFDPPAGKSLRQDPANARSDFERLKEKQSSSGEQPWAPFSSAEDWDCARWIMESGLSQRQIDGMLKLDIVRKYHPLPGLKRHDSPKLS